MSEKDLNDLLEKYSQSGCTQEEIRRLEAWYLKLGELNEGEDIQESQIRSILQAIKEKIQLREERQPRYLHTMVRQWRFWAAAVLIGFLALGEWYIIHQRRQTPLELSQSIDIDRQPADVKAFLQQEDGTRIALHNAQSGAILASQEDLQIQYSDSGLIYMPVETMDEQAKGPAKMHLIQTPLAGQYQVRLSDGTEVWLNAGSSLRFPTRFDQNERKVQVTGEVFFAVKKMKRVMKNGEKLAVPFVVETEKQRIEVLGTEFNVHAYADEQKQYTSLLSGSVRVKLQGSKESMLLRPGQTVAIGKGLRMENGKSDELLAWKKGDFYFKDQKLGTILRTLGRWYDVEIDCPNELLELTFSGMVSRKQPLSAVILMLNNTQQVKINLKGGRLIVRK